MNKSNLLKLTKMDYIKLKDNEGLYRIYYDYAVEGIGVSFDYPNKIKVHTESGRVTTYTIGKIGLYNRKDLYGGREIVIEDESSIEKFRKLYAD